MQVGFFDQTKICIVCGKRREWCICQKNVKPCTCNVWLVTNPMTHDCPVCKGRGWIDERG